MYFVFEDTVNTVNIVEAELADNYSNVIEPKDAVTVVNAKTSLSL